MKRSNKLTWLATIAMTFIFIVIMSTYAFAEGRYVVDTGECGDATTYTLYSDGELQISGTGQMSDFVLDYTEWDENHDEYIRVSSAPWSDNRLDIKGVTIESGVTSIGKYAFSGCTNMTHITIPKSVNYSGMYSFSNCWGIERVDVENLESYLNIKLGGRTTSVPTRYKATVYENGADTHIVCNGVAGSTATFILKDGILSIMGTGELYDCEESSAGWDRAEIWKEIKSIEVGEGITEISYSTFSGLSNLVEVNLSNTVECIHEDAFCDCESLQEITIPESVTYVGDAFGNCRKLKDIYFMNKNCEIEITGSRFSKATVVHGLKDSTAYDFANYIGNQFSEICIHNYQHVVESKAGNLRNGYEYDKCSNCGSIINEVRTDGYSTSYVKSLKVKAAKKALTVSWKKQSKAVQKKFSGYQIQYSTSSKMTGAKTVTVKKTISSKKLTKLSSKKKYYVQVRTYTVKNGTKFYSKWAKKTCKTK